MHCTREEKGKGTRLGNLWSDVTCKLFFQSFSASSLEAFGSWGQQCQSCSSVDLCSRAGTAQ